MIRTFFMLSCLTVLTLFSFGVQDAFASRTLDQGLDLFRRGQYEQAIPLLRKAKEESPSDPTIQRYLMIYDQQVVEPFCKKAALAYYDKNYVEAVSAWEKVLTMSPDNDRVRRLIEIALENTDYETLESLYANANKLINDTSYDLAMEELRKIIETYPNERKARKMLASIQSLLEDKKVREHYEKALAFVGEKKYDNALEELRAILKLVPDHELAQRQIVAINRMKFESLYVDARSLVREGKYLAAKDKFDDILVENPTDPEAMLSSERLGEIANLKTDLSYEGSAWDMMRIGIAQYILDGGDPKASVAASWYATQMDPNNNELFAFRDFLEDHNENAARYLEPPLENMNIVEQYLFGALNHIYSGRYDIAVEKCSLILKLEPGNTLALKRLGSAYYLMRNRTAASNAWTRAMKIAPNDPELKEFIDLVK